MRTPSVATLIVLSLLNLSGTTQTSWYRVRPGRNSGRKDRKCHPQETKKDVEVEGDRIINDLKRVRINYGRDTGLDRTWTVKGNDGRLLLVYSLKLNLYFDSKTNQFIKRVLMGLSKRCVLSLDVTRDYETHFFNRSPRNLDFGELELYKNPRMTPIHVNGRY